MLAKVRYRIDGATKTDVFKGYHIAVQIFPDRRGAVTVFRKNGKIRQEDFYEFVYTVTRIFD